MKIKRGLCIVLAVLAVAVLCVVIGVRSKKPMPESDTFENTMQQLVTDLVDKDSGIRSCVLSVRSGDGTVACSAAAGIAEASLNAVMTTDTPYYIASITKMFTATAVMMLCENGELSLSDTMEMYLPDELIQGLCVYDGIDYTNTITIEHLLSQTSGIADYYSGSADGGLNAFEQFLADPGRRWTVEETIGIARRLPALSVPGRECHYADTNYQLLGLILERVTGKPLNEIFDNYFFTPLKMDNTWLVNFPRTDDQRSGIPADIYLKDTVVTDVRKNGSYWADGGIISTAEDGIRFIRALKEGRLVKAETLSRMMQWKKITFPREYGFGLDRIVLPKMMTSIMKEPKVPALWGHSGSSASFLYYSEAMDVYLSGTINLTDENFKAIKLLISVQHALYNHYKATEEG